MTEKLLLSWNFNGRADYICERDIVSEIFNLNLCVRASKQDYVTLLGLFQFCLHPASGAHPTPHPIGVAGSLASFFF
jgi:hypothetical protein